MGSGIRIGAAAAAVVLLAGCGGTTVHGAVPTPPPETAMPHRPARAATPSATPTEEREYLQGPPPIAYRTQEGAATLHIRRFSWQRTPNGQQAAPPQHRYLILDIQIAATEGRVQVNPLYFVARTPGQTYAPTMGADGNEPVLASTELSANQTVEGVVAFDAPATHLTVQINDELGRNVGEVVVPAPPGPMEPVEPPAEPDPPAGPVEAPAEPNPPAEPVEAPAEPVEAPAEPVEAPAEPVEAPAEPVEAPAEFNPPAEPVEAPAEPVEAPAEPVEAPAEPVEAPGPAGPASGD